MIQQIFERCTKEVNMTIVWSVPSSNIIINAHLLWLLQNEVIVDQCHPTTCISGTKKSKINAYLVPKSKIKKEALLPTE